MVYCFHLCLLNILSNFPFLITFSHFLQRKDRAEEIHDQHLKPCASLPVNVDSTAIKEVEANLQDASSELFSSLQYQVNSRRIIV